MMSAGQIITQLQSIRDGHYKEGDHNLSARDTVAADLSYARAEAISEAIRIVIEGIN